MLEFCLWDALTEFKCITSFEDYLDFGVLKYPSKFLIQSLDVRDCDKGFFCVFLVGGLVHMKPVVWFLQEPVAVPVQNPV